MNHHQLEEDTIDLSTIQAACEVLAGNIKIMQDKINDDEDQTPPLFYGSTFISAKDVISPADDPELFDFGNNDERIDTKVDVPEKNAAEFSLKIDQILETPIFESEKLLENLNHLKNYCKQHKIEIDANLKLISDAIYDGNETVLISELQKLK